MAEQRRTVAGAVAGLASGGVLLGASAVTLGPPNLGLAGQFLSGSYPSMQSAVAFLSLVCYAVVLTAVALALVRGLRMAVRGTGTSRSIRAIALVLAGVVLLSLSVVNRVDGGGGICCGGGTQQIREAASLAR
ncbi:MAG: hypothetical protein ABR950_07645 [Candidatus Dormibacteria bacterium]